MSFVLSSLALSSFFSCFHVLDTFLCKSVQKSSFQIFVLISSVITSLPSSHFRFLHVPLEFRSSKFIQLLSFPDHTPSFRTVFSGFSSFQKPETFLFSWNNDCIFPEYKVQEHVSNSASLLFPPNFIKE